MPRAGDLKWSERLLVPGLSCEVACGFIFSLAMDFRLDRVLTDSGVVKNARTYTLLIDRGWLYILPLGPGRAQAMPRTSPLTGWLTRWMIEKMLARAEREIVANEAVLDASGPAAFSAGARHALASVSDVSAEGNRLRLTANGTDWTFYGTGVLDDRDRSAELAAFASALRAASDEAA